MSHRVEKYVYDGSVMVYTYTSVYVDVMFPKLCIDSTDSFWVQTNGCVSRMFGNFQFP